MKKILLLICWCIASQAFGQVKLEATLDSSRLLIGDQTYLRLKLTQKPNWTAFMPDKFDLGKQIEIIDETKLDTLPSENGDFITVKSLLITTFDSGQVKVPPIAVAFKNPNTGTIDTVYSRPLFIHVSTVALTDSSTLKPIKDIFLEKATFEDYVIYFIIFGVLVVVGALIWYFFIRKKEEKALPPPPAILPEAHEIALEKLYQLSKEELWQKGEVKQYQSQLTEIIREYIGERYHILAMKSTTFEIIQQLKDKLSTEQTTKLREILEIADLVKFAKAKPPLEINQRFMDDAVKFVKDTRS
jgi:hypothetical protein